MVAFRSAKVAFRLNVGFLGWEKAKRRRFRRSERRHSQRNEKEFGREWSEDERKVFEGLR
jgi:hypothetical protein